MRQEQEATFFYANAAPRSEEVQRGNWEKLEEAVRKKVRA